MAETANVTAPVSDKPPATSWAIGRLAFQHYDNQGNVAWAIDLQVVEWYTGGVRERDIHLRGPVDAAPLVKQINTKNFGGANPSMEKVIMQWLIANGYYPASTYTGTPEV
jgi:hypothetical protein